MNFHKLVLRLAFGVTLVHRRLFQSKEQAEVWRGENLPAEFEAVREDQVPEDAITVPLEGM